MRNIRLTVEYEGTGYAGWQVQNGLPTIQGALMEAARRLTGDEGAGVSGASRTDAGVHAMGQVASLRTVSSIPCYNVMQGMNALLPPDIAVKAAAEMPEDFDPRRGSTGKVYLYRIVNRPYRSALLRNFSWHIFAPLDIDAMREAAAHLIGEKDFSSFRAADSDAPHSVREVTSVLIARGDEGLIDIEVRGTAFLRHMVRIMTGTLVAVGKGKLKPGAMPGIIEARDRASAGMTAPPQGLVLVKVEY